jgi:hypothetical protein
MHTRLASALLASLSLAASSALGHHGVSAYDMAVVDTAEGLVEAWEWQNPHTSLTLRVRRDGRAQAFQIEGAPPRWMEGQGWTPASLTEGEAVTVTYHPARRPDSGGYEAILMEVKRADGSVLKVNRPASLGGP